MIHSNFRLYISTRQRFDTNIEISMNFLLSLRNSNDTNAKFTEWARVSNTNVCYLTYAYEHIPESRLKILFASQEIVKTQRSVHSATSASNLILNIRNHCVKSEGFGCWVYMSQVTVVGYSLGAHIASQICVNLYKSSGQKVGKLIGAKLINSFDFIHHLMIYVYCSII